MRTGWWKHPRLALFYGLLGAIVGAVMGILLIGFPINWAIEVLDAGEGYSRAYSGVSGVFLIGEAVAFSVALGSATGCALVHYWGKYRFEAGWILMAYSAVMALLSAWLGLDAASSYGKRFALAFNGVFFIYSFLVIIFGCCMMARPKNHWC